MTKDILIYMKMTNPDRYNEQDLFIIITVE